MTALIFILILVLILILDLIFRKEKSVVQMTIDSLHNEKYGFSYRKICGALVLGSSLYYQYQHVTPENLIEISTVNLTFVAVCAGLVTAQQILDRGQKPKNEPAAS